MPSPRHPRIALALALAPALALTACVARPAPPAAAPAAPLGGPVVVQGTVTYKQRVALPPNAVVRVQLIDAARADAPAPVLAEQVIATQGNQMPFAFVLRAPAVASTARPQVQARIEVDGTLRFISTAAYPVTSSTVGRPIEIVVDPVAAPH